MCVALDSIPSRVLKKLTRQTFESTVVAHTYYASTWEADEEGAGVKVILAYTVNMGPA